MKDKLLGKKKDKLLGKKVAFILNAAYVVPAIITRSYPDGRCNLEIQEIFRETVNRVVGKGLNAKVEEEDAFVIKKKTRQSVMEGNPLAIFSRTPVELSRPMQGNGMLQTHTDRWDIAGLRRLPRLSGIDTNLIGKWFDPSKWNYKIYCQMEGFRSKILKRDFLAIEMTFPDDGRESYDDFEECFKRWFEEALENRYMRENGIPALNSVEVGSWTRCEMQAVEKEVDEFDLTSDGHTQVVDDEPTYEELLAMYKRGKNGNLENLKRDQPTSQGNQRGVKANKSRAPHSRASLSRNRKGNKK